MLRSNQVRWMVCVMALASALVPMVASAGPVGGSQYAVHRIGAYSSQTFNVSFWAGEPGRINVQGDGTTLLEVRVYDKDGLMTSDRGFGFLTVTWNTYKTGSF